MLFNFQTYSALGSEECSDAFIFDLGSFFSRKYWHFSFRENGRKDPKADPVCPDGSACVYAFLYFLLSDPESGRKRFMDIGRVLAGFSFSAGLRCPEESSEVMAE